MTSPVTIENGKMYGHRARIGYTSPPLTTEIFPYEFYKIVPDGVSLVVASLAIVVRSKDEVDQSYDISMRAAREMAAAGCDICMLGGVPINLSRGTKNAEQMIADLEAEIGIKVSSSAAVAGEGRQGARLQEGRGGAALRPFRHRPHRRLFRALRLRAARRHRLGQRVQPHRCDPAACCGRDGPQTDEGASRRQLDPPAVAALADRRRHRRAGEGIRRQRDDRAPGDRVGGAAPLRRQRQNPRNSEGCSGSSNFHFFFFCSIFSPHIFFGAQRNAGSWSIPDFFVFLRSFFHPGLTTNFLFLRQVAKLPR